MRLGYREDYLPLPLFSAAAYRLPLDIRPMHDVPHVKSTPLNYACTHTMSHKAHLNREEHGCSSDGFFFYSLTDGKGYLRRSPCRPTVGKRVSTHWAPIGWYLDRARRKRLPQVARYHRSVATGGR